MASRAFFRCRACGEPVVAGAYRCPVCAIDFPTGTPGAPAAADSPAAVDPARPGTGLERGGDTGAPGRARGEPGERSLASGVPAQVRADMIAARLDQALVEELSPAPAATPTPAPGPERGPEPATAAAGEAADADLDLVPAAADPSADAGWIEATPGARLDAVPSPRLGPPPERAGDPVPGADLSLAPGRERPPRERAAALPPPPPAVRDLLQPRSESRELVPVRPRRNKARSLAATIAIALLVLGGIGAAGYVISGTRLMGLAGGGGPESGAPLRVATADGWVSVPPGERTMVITSDGPYRLRLDGVVYSVAGDRTTRVHMTPETSLAIRTVGAASVAEVAPAQ